MTNGKKSIKEQFNELKDRVVKQIEDIDIEAGRTWGISWYLYDDYDNMIRLVELHELSKKAKEFLLEKKELIFKERYQKLINTNIWARARELVIKIFTNGKMSILNCAHCGKEIDYSKGRFQLHHEDYDIEELFNPMYVKFAHEKCHEEIHGF